LTTIAIAFQRIHERRRSSYSRLPGQCIFEVGGDGIDVSGVAGERDVGAAAARQVDQALHQVMGAFRTLVFDDGFECFKPFLGFEGVRIVGGWAVNWSS
jgi:hypothetical protein